MKQILIISLLLSAAFFLFAGLTSAYYVDNTVLTTVKMNGTMYCSVSGVGNCPAVAVNVASFNISKNYTDSYNLYFEFGWSSGGGSPNPNDRQVVVDNTTNPPKFTDGSGNVLAANGYSILNSTLDGYNFTIRANLPIAVVNMTVFFKYFDPNQGTNNFILNASLNIPDLVSRHVTFPAPSVYCADNNTLVVTTPTLVFNGTAQVLQNITTIQICYPGVFCNNQSLFGPACDPPVLQQPLYIAGFALFLIIILAGIVFLLKKVL